MPLILMYDINPIKFSRGIAFYKRGTHMYTILAFLTAIGLKHKT